MIPQIANERAWKQYLEQERHKINIVGFNKRRVEDPNQYFHCANHSYARLLHVKNEIGLWQCPECGIRYLESQLVNKTVLQSKRSRNRKSIVGSLKREKKLLDQKGNPINPNDKDIQLDIAEGRTIKEYHEFTH